MLLDLNPDALVLFWRDTSGLLSSIDGLELAWTDWSRGAATPETEVLPALARLSRMLRAERVLRLDEERCRRAVVGIMVAPAPEVEV